MLFKCKHAEYPDGYRYTMVKGARGAIYERWSHVQYDIVHRKAVVKK